MGRGSRHWYQDTFISGMDEINWRRPGSVSLIENGYLSDSGTIIKRGGKTSLATLTAATGAQSAGALIEGVNGFALYSDATNDVYYAVDETDGTDVNLTTGLEWYNGSSWTTWTPTGFTMTDLSYASSKDEVFMNIGGEIYRWYGGEKQNYTTGTISGTSATSTITGSGTSWLSNVEAGMYFVVPQTSNPRVYRIESVDSDTSITLDRNLNNTHSGIDYNIMPIAPLTAEDSTLKGTGASANFLLCHTYGLAYHQSRVFFVDQSNTSRIRWSYTPSEAASTTDKSYQGPSRIDTAAYLDVGEGIGGDITGLVSMGNELIVIKQSAIYTVRGVFASDGTDLGATVEMVTDSVGVPQNPGFAWDITPLGLVISTYNGMYVYRPGQFSLFGNDRIKPENLRRKQVKFISSPVDRIIIMDDTDCYEYDLGRDAWLTQTFSNGLTVPIVMNNGQYCVSVEDGVGTLLRWDLDRTHSTNEADNGSNSQPLLRVVSQPVSVGASPALTGRPNVLYSVTNITTDASGTPTITASVNGTSSANTAGENDADTTTRHPIEGIDKGPRFKMTLQHGDGTCGYMDVSGMGMDFEVSNAVRP